MWDVFTAAGIEREDFYPLRNFDEDEMLKLLRWQDETLAGDGFMPWTPFDHSQLGPLEIGGWKRMYTYRNPPPATYLEEMARANCRFTLRHAAAAPRLRLRDLRVEPIGTELFRIEVVVDNTGYLPTNLSQQAIAMREAKPVAIRLSGPKTMQFTHGMARQELGHLAGRSNRPTTYSRFYDWSASAHCARWTVRLDDLPAELQLDAGTPRAGTVCAQIAIAADGAVTVTPDYVLAGRTG